MRQPAMSCLGKFEAYERSSCLFLTLARQESGLLAPCPLKVRSSPPKSAHLFFLDSALVDANCASHLGNVFGAACLGYSANTCFDLPRLLGLVGTRQRQSRVT